MLTEADFAGVFDAEGLGVTATLDGRTVSGSVQRDFVDQDGVESAGPALRVFASAVQDLTHGDPVVIVSDVEGAGSYAVQSIEPGRDGVFTVLMLEDRS